MSSPLEGVNVRIVFSDKEKIVQTNKAGIFDTVFVSDKLEHRKDSEWQQASVSLPDHPSVHKQDVPVLIEGRSNTYGIISDVDDTVLVSNATQKLKLVYSTIFKSPTQRKPFDGVDHVYQALVAGPNEVCTNPIFYVSSSHWNLYEFLRKFFIINDIPKGPLLLKETSGIRSVITSTGKHDHKEERIKEVLDAYPDLSFILIGDSGQKDAYIYSNVARTYPDRILVIYIRDVTPHVDDLVEEAKDSLRGITEVVAVKTSAELADHAARHGYIQKHAT